MKFFKVALVLSLSIMLVLLAGCGSTEKKVAKVRLTLDSLRANGVPDSLLTEVDVLCFRAETESKRGSPGKASKAIKELGWKTKYPKLETIVQSAWKFHTDHPNGYEE